MTTRTDSKAKAPEHAVPSVETLPLYDPYIGKEKEKGRDALNVSVPYPATNYVSLNRPIGTISGHYTIDPTIEVPAVFLPPEVTGEKRKNLLLQTTVGTISADVTIVHNPDKTLPLSEKVELETRCMGTGTVSTRIHSSDHPKRAPFRLLASSTCGTVDVYVPRSFQGTISISGFGPVQCVSLSSALRRAAGVLNQGSGKSSYFVGDCSNLARCDEVVIVAKCGAVSVKYDDEYLGR